MKDIKAKVWTFLIYEDSAPNNWREMLEELCIPCAVSPLHDKDVNPTGEQKKAHRHVILRWESATTYNNVLRITQEFNSPIPKKVESTVGMYRYLTHKDNPEKYQYNESDIILFGGFDLDMFDTMKTGERQRLLDDIEDLLESENINEYYQLVKYLRSHDMKKHLYIVRNNTIYLSSLIRSKRYSKEKQLEEREKLVYNKFQEFLEYGVITDDTIKGLTELFGEIKVID